MSRPNQFAWLLALSSVMAVECSKPECEVNNSAWICAATTDLTGGERPKLSSRRVNILGDKVTVTGSTTRAEDEVTITQDGAAPVRMGTLGSTGEVRIPPLMGMKTGKANLTIGINPPEPIRIYLEPVFATNSFAGISVDDQPLWVGIGDGKKLVMLSDTRATTSTAPIHFLEYNPDNLTLPVETGKYPRTPILVTLAGAVKFSAHAEHFAIPADTVVLRRCPIGASSCDTQEIWTGYKWAMDMSAGRLGDVLGLIADDAVEAYFISAGWGNANKVSLAMQKAALIAAGDLDDDGKSDFIVWDGTKKLTAFKQTSQSFVEDTSLSQQLSGALSSDVPLQLMIQDMDGDGLEDVVYSMNGQVTWLTHLGLDKEGKATFAKKASGPIETRIVFDSFSVGDLNGDKRPDLAVAAGTSDKKFGYFLNQATSN